MGTRTVIRVKKGKNYKDLYRHWDGYPEEILQDFSKVQNQKNIDEIFTTLNDNHRTKMKNYALADFKKKNPNHQQKDIDNFLKEFDSNERNNEDIYRVTDPKEGLHGDIEYLYYFDANCNFMRTFQMDYEVKPNSVKPNTEYTPDNSLINLTRLYSHIGKSINEITGDLENYFDKRIRYHDSEINDAISRNNKNKQQAFQQYKNYTMRLKENIPFLDINNPNRLRDNYYFKDIKGVSHTEYFRAVEETLLEKVKEFIQKSEDEDNSYSKFHQVDTFFNSFLHKEFNYKSEQTLISNVVSSLKEKNKSLSTTEAVNSFIDTTAKFIKIDKESLNKEIEDLKQLRVDVRVLNRGYDYLVYKREQGEQSIEKEQEFLEKVKEFNEKYGDNELFTSKATTIENQIKKDLGVESNTIEVDPLDVLNSYKDSKYPTLDNQQQMSLSR